MYSLEYGATGAVRDDFVMSITVREHQRARLAAALTLVLIAPMVVGAPPSESESLSRPTEATALYVTGITTPSRSATLACMQQAQIVRYLVKEGDWVHTGQQLIEMDEGVLAARAQASSAEAESELQIELRHAQHEHAQAELSRVRALAEQNSASVQEVNDAESNARITRLQHQIAIFERAQAGRVYERDALLLAELRIRAPFDGYVALRAKQDGEIVEQREGMLVLVQLDPLEVVLDCPLALAPRARPGDRYVVRPADPQWQPRVGTISFASRVADAGSQTYRVKLTVENEDGGWMSGIKVVADFSDQVPADALDSVAQAQRDRETAP